MSNKDHGPDHPEHYEELEIDLREYIMLLWKRKWVIIGLILIAAVGAYFYTVMTTEVSHRATSEVLLMPPRYTEIEVSRMDRSTYANLAQSDDILNRIIEKMDLRDEDDELLHPADIEDNMELSIMEFEVAAGDVEASSLVRMEVTHTDPEKASEIANTWAELFEEDTLDVRRGEIEEIYEVTARRFEETEENLEESQQRLEELKKDVRLEQLIDRKEIYRDDLQEIEAEFLSLREELGSLQSEKDHVSSTLAELEAEDEIWTEEFHIVLNEEAPGGAARDLIEAQRRLVEARQKYSIDLLELKSEQKEEQLAHYRERLTDLENKEADGQREELFQLEDDLAEQRAEINAIEKELEALETDEGLWLGDRTLTEIEDMNPEMAETIANYRDKREELFAFWEEQDLIGKEDRLEFLRELIQEREAIMAGLEDDLKQAESDLDELEQVLEEEPEVQTLRRSLSEDAFWENIFAPEELEIMSELLLEDEEINPVYQALRQERADLQVKVSSIPEQIGRFSESIENLEEEKEDLRVEVRELEEKQADLEADLALYEDMYLDWEDDFRDLRRERVEAEREKSALETRMDLLEVYENPRIAQQKYHYESLISEKEEEISELTAEIETYRDEIALLEQDVDHYQELYDHRAGEYRNLKNRYFDLGIELDEIEAQLNYYSSRQNEIRAELEAIEDQVWEHERRLETLEREVERYEESYERLASQMEDARLAEAEQTSDVRFVSAAIPPGRTIGRGTTLNVAIAAVLAGMFGVFVVFFREFMKEEEEK